ncbi:MAG: hypothetical protein LBU35_00440 [Holosporales bacterium]|nr:hypothetical protein [Holosporales bacterium]
MIDEKELLKVIRDFFVKSRNFNGIQLDNLVYWFYPENVRYKGLHMIIGEPTNVSDLKGALLSLVKNESITIVKDGNSNIKRFPDVSVNKQIAYLDNLPNIYLREEHNEDIFSNKRNHPFLDIGLYPSEKILRKDIPKVKLLEQPKYSRLLQLGYPQLTYRYFQTNVLDRYKDDPIYEVKSYGSEGLISCRNTPDDNSVNLRYGLAYRGENYERHAICVYLRDLHQELPAKHQKYWESFEIDSISEKCAPDYDYYKCSILGEFPEKVSIFEAFLEEQKMINQMTTQVYGKSFFKEDFSNIYMPEFQVPINETSKNYREFIVKLNKIFCDNLNPKFFDGQISTLQKLYDKNGKCIKSERKGTVSMLKEFLEKYFKPRNSKNNIKEDVINVWQKEIIPERAKECHKYQENVCDANIHEKQKNIMRKAYVSVRTIRLILQNHPEVRKLIDNGCIKIPDWLYKGEIRSY